LRSLKRFFAEMGMPRLQRSTIEEAPFGTDRDIFRDGEEGDEVDSRGAITTSISPKIRLPEGWLVRPKEGEEAGTITILISPKNRLPKGWLV